MLTKHHYLLKIFTCLVILSISLTAFSIAEEKYDVRKLKWGYSLDKVKAAEPGLQELDGKYIAEDKINNFDVLVYFDFVNNRLERVFYIFKHEPPAGMKFVYLAYFQMVEELLCEKYGKQFDEKKTWRDGADKTKVLSDALVAGDVTIEVNRATKTTDIQHFVGDKGRDIVHFISYSSKDFEEKSKKAEATKDIEKL